MTSLNFAPLRLLAFAVFGLVLLGAAPAARAQSCNEDLGKLGEQRNAEIKKLNDISKSHGGKLDPIAACPVLQKLKSVEASMSAYMVKNKDWCNLPEELVNNFHNASGRTATMAGQACALAVKAKQMQQQGGMAGPAMPAVKLPAGPL